MTLLRMVEIPLVEKNGWDDTNPTGRTRENQIADSKKLVFEAGKYLLSRLFAGFNAGRLRNCRSATHFREKQIFDLAISSDGQSPAYVRGEKSVNVVLVQGAKVS